jgi:NADH:ubiquinone oxidoreductase subunit E
VTPEQQRAGALEAIERIVNRGGEDDAVLEAVHGVVSKLGHWTADDAAFVARVTRLTSAYCIDPEKMRSIFSG